MIHEKVSSLTAPPSACPPAGTHAVSPEGSGFQAVAPLDSDVCRDMRWCINCGGQQIFVEVFETDFGRVGCCLGCGEERVIRFSRTNSEAC